MKVKCFNCQKIVNRTASQAKRSKRHYCSRSCAITVNNKVPKRKKAAKIKPTILCVVCDSVIPNASRAAKYCYECTKKRNTARTSEHRRKIKRRAVDYLGGKCITCGYSRSMHALDFHHRDPSEKDFTVSQYANLSWDKIVKELEKCDLLCANCHRELHDSNIGPEGRN